MTSGECIEILTPALRNLRGRASVADAIELDRLLGVDEYGSYFRREKNEPMAPEIRNVYIALAGPHAQTVLKIWQIKKGLNADGTPKANCEVE